MKALRAVLIIAFVAAAFVAGFGYARRHPAAAPPAKNERKILYWVDPMHPAYKSDKPGIAPDCGMALEPVYADQNPAPQTAPEAVPISAEKQQLIGVKYGTAEYTAGGESIRAVGKIAADENRVGHVHAKTEGWIDQVFVGATGDLVRKGQPLLTLYSPDLLATQQEYLLALKSRDLMRGSTVQGTAGDSERLVEAARRRLELWDLTPAQIEQLERTQQPVKAVTLYSPVAGYVVTRNAFPGQKIMPDTDLYTVVDLSRVWVVASVFEYQAAQVRIGQTATVELPYQAGRRYSAKVGFIVPQVDPTTRTLQVRLELPNSGLQLKPDMFVNVEFASGQSRALTVPAEAVVDLGTRKVVYEDLGDGHFAPRDVQTGQRMGDRIQILGGLTAGERVVTSGNFLISSESQLRAGQ